jgi:predicted NUDIX family phosphoesterase
MPLLELLSSVGTIAPAQMVNEVPKLKVGVIFGVTVKVNDVVVAH